MYLQILCKILLYSYGPNKNLLERIIRDDADLPEAISVLVEHSLVDNPMF